MSNDEFSNQISTGGTRSSAIILLVSCSFVAWRAEMTTSISTSPLVSGRALDVSDGALSFVLRG